MKKETSASDIVLAVTFAVLAGIVLGKFVIPFVWVP
jgi:hypothetical protein